MNEAYLNRYKPLVKNEWNTFKNALLTPTTPNFWCNTLKINTKNLKNYLPGIKQTGDITFSSPDKTKASDSLAMKLGLIHFQEKVSMLPSYLIEDVDNVLDMCAAPGNKSLLLSVLKKEQISITANDYDVKRLRVLIKASERLGVANIQTTHFDASTYPGKNGSFKNVMADVPCSCEGTVRKNPKILDHPSLEFSQNLAKLQFNILRRAFKLCDYGGRIIYSTCTFSPEENECVINRFLDSYSNKATLEPLTGLPLEPSQGLTEWGGQKLSDDMKYTGRFWPHIQKEGGFFIACIRKSMN